MILTNLLTKICVYVHLLLSISSYRVNTHLCPVCYLFLLYCKPLEDHCTVTRLPNKIQKYHNYFIPVFNIT